MERTKQITTTALMVTLAAVLSLILYVFPFATFVVCIPLMVVGIKYDMKTQALATLALLLLILMLDPFYALVIGFMVAPMSLVQAYAIKGQKHTSEVIFIGTVAMVLGTLAFVYGTNFIFQINIVEDYKLMLDEATDMMRNMYSDQGISASLEALDQMKDYIMLLMPSFVTFFGFFSSVLSYMVTHAVFKRIRIPMRRDYFKDFRIDRHKRIYLVTVMAVVTLGAFLDQANMDYYILNFMTVLFLILQINGLALIWFFTEKHPNRKALRVVTMVLYIAAPMIPIIEFVARYGLAILGFTDMYTDFRSRFKTKDDTK